MQHALIGLEIIFFFRNLKYFFHCPLAAKISLRNPVLFLFDLSFEFCGKDI